MNRAFFSRIDEARAGAFHELFGLVEMTLSPPAAAALRAITEDRPALEGAPEDPAVRLRIAYEVCSFVHEMRHCVDLYGTIAGLSLVANQLKVLKNFAADSAVLCRSGERWPLPLSTPGALDALPARLRDTIRDARAMAIAAEIFTAPFAPVEIPGHSTALRISLPYEAYGEVDGFPLRLLRGSAAGMRARTVLHPLGLEALLEGNAHAICRDLVEAYFPAELAGELQRQMFLLGQDAGDQAAAGAILPYMITDLLVSRWTRRHDVAQFPRSIILGLTDRALGESEVRLTQPAPGATAMDITRSGKVFVELLEAQDPQRIRQGEVTGGHATERYRRLLAEYEKGGDWDTVPDDHSPLASLRIWESYLLQHFVVPILRERIASGGAAFTTTDGYLRLVGKLGLPPARVVDGQLMLDRMPQRVQHAWHHLVMLSVLLRQLLHTEDYIFCPRARGMLPGIESVNYAVTGTCSTHLRLGCGSFRAGEKREDVPDCLFESALHVAALKPPTAAAG